MIEKIAILGAGISGLSLGYFLREHGYDCTIYEKENTYGGLCNGFSIDGFTFDTFAHISFDNDPISYQLLEGKTEFLTHPSEALNYDCGRWIKDPVQNNLFALPVEERIRVIKDFVDRKESGSPKDYGQWLKSRYGNYFALHYPYRYTRKYWTVEPEQLEPRWISGRMYEPTLKEVLYGAMSDQTPDVHYSKEARYPKAGGFKSFLKPLAEGQNICYSHEVSMIYPQKKKIVFTNGETVSYDILFSTLPLDFLCSSIADIPADVKAAGQLLDHTSGAMISIALKKPRVSPSLWFYIYDEDILPARVYSPDWKSPANVPERCSALQAEVYFSKYKPLRISLEQLKGKVIEGLLKLDLFSESDILFSDIRYKEYANIMFTKPIYAAKQKVLNYLNDSGIYTAGRFGKWDYLWVGQCIKDAYNTVEAFLKHLKEEKQ